MRALVQFPKMGEAGAMNFLRNYPTGDIPDEAWPKQTHRMRNLLADLRQKPDLGGKLKFLARNIADLIEHNYKDNFVERITNLETIALSEQGSNRELPEFLDSYTTSKFGDKEHPEDHITISTIHSSKGLEWNYVWIVGMGSLQMPHSRSKTPDELAEELRLAYVAVTRARDHLVCSYCETVQNGLEQFPSPFLPSDLPWHWYDSNGELLPAAMQEMRRKRAMADEF